MARRLGIKLRLHRASGRLCKTIGYALARDGRPKKRLWYFDPVDEAAALTRCAELKARWRALRAGGRRLWDECPTYAAEYLGATQTTAASMKYDRPVTVDDAAKMYLALIEQRMHAQQVTVSLYEQQMRNTPPRASQPIGRSYTPSQSTEARSFAPLFLGVFQRILMLFNRGS